MKCKLAAIALICCATLMCSESNADLLGRMTARGCGDCQPAPTSPRIRAGPEANRAGVRVDFARHAVRGSLVGSP